MQYFYINKDSVLPKLRVELIDDGKFEFRKTSKFSNAVQNATILFSMWDENDVLKISEAECNIVESEESGCETKYVLEYAWKPRDTKKVGQYKGQFKITFNGDLSEAGATYPSGDLIVPIFEDLIIMVK